MRRSQLLEHVSIPQERDMLQLVRSWSVVRSASSWPPPIVRRSGIHAGYRGRTFPGKPVDGPCALGTLKMPHGSSSTRLYSASR